MIGRMWRGWAKPENADKYETLLREEIFPGIAAKNVDGYREIQLFRRAVRHGSIEFTTIMWFESWDAVREFAGEDFETAYAPEKAREVLDHWDDHSRHYEIKERVTY